MAKWISELNLTKGEKVVLVAVMCVAETDIAPTIDNIGRFSIEFAKEVLRLNRIINLLSYLDHDSWNDADSLIEKVFNE